MLMVPSSSTGSFALGSGMAARSTPTATVRPITATTKWRMRISVACRYPNGTRSSSAPANLNDVKLGCDFNEGAVSPGAGGRVEGSPGGLGGRGPGGRRAAGGPGLGSHSRASSGALQPDRTPGAGADRPGL